MINEENNELAEMRKACELKVGDLLLTALALSEMLESYTDTPRADGGRPLRRVQMVWEDAADLITQMQLSAKYCADEITALLSELDYHLNRRKDTARTLEQYAAELTEAREKMREARRLEGVWADICHHLWGLCADRMTDEEKAAHAEFKAALLKKTE